VVVVSSEATYVAGKYAEGGRPVILSVVRAREAGDLDAPIRTGDDIEIRGAGFVPPGAQGADRLTRMVVRIGTVNVHVPLVPVTDVDRITTPMPGLVFLGMSNQYFIWAVKTERLDPYQEIYRCPLPNAR